MITASGGPFDYGIIRYDEIAKESSTGQDSEFSNVLITDLIYHQLLSFNSCT